MNNALKKVTTGRIISLGAFAFLPLSVKAPHAIALLLPLVAIAGSIMQWRDKRPFTFSSRYWLMVIGLFHVWIFASLLWSPLPFVGLTYALKVTLTSVWGVLLLMLIEGLNEDEKGSIASAFVWGGIATIILIIVYVVALSFTGGMMNVKNGDVDKFVKPNILGLNRASSLLCLFVWLGLYFLKEQKRPTWVRSALFCIAGIIIACLKSDAALVALVLGCFFWVCCRTDFLVFVFRIFDYRLFFRAISLILTLILIIIMPYAIKSRGPPVRMADKTVLQIKHSYDHRFFMWYDLSNYSLEKPIVGHGFASTRYMRGPTLYPHTVQGGFEAPTHPHNAPLEVWSDLGVIGALLFSFSALLIPLGIERIQDRRSKSLLFALFTSAIILCYVSYGFWQIWWQSSLWFFGALARLGYKEASLQPNKLEKAIS